MALKDWKKKRGKLEFMKEEPDDSKTIVVVGKEIDGTYSVLIINNGDWKMLRKKRLSKSQALKYAKEYMRKH